MDKKLNSPEKITTTILKCRNCESQLFDCIVVLKNMPLTDDFIDINKCDHHEYLRDISIYECGKCGLVQNPFDFDYGGYYRDYQYSSGHSPYVKKFMKKYAETIVSYYELSNMRKPKSAIEVGSGDGVQLLQFMDLGVTQVMGVEPSDYLARIAIAAGVPTLVELFGTSSTKGIAENFDICLSSYTLDHVRNPIEYLKTAYSILKPDGIIAFEIHNLEKIIERTEYCLFEHEHTIYMTSLDATRFIEDNGFKVLAIDPIPLEYVRGNSLIVIAKKVSQQTEVSERGLKQNNLLPDLNSRITATISRIDEWINSIPKDENIVGFGAGGRGIMTLAALENPHRFSALFDTNYESNKYLSPKTRIPIVGPSEWSLFADSYCLIFSFGYFQEIKDQLIKIGFIEEKIISLSDFFPEENH